MNVASRKQSPRTIRVVGGTLAVIWLVAGVAALAAAISSSRWLLLLVALTALWYSTVWLRAARQGRLLTLMEALTPWRFEQHPDA
jgi:hypothetical protein